MERKQRNPQVGDVFTIPLGNGRAAVAQVLDLVDPLPFVGVFADEVDVDEPSIEKVDLRKPEIVTTTMDAHFVNGKWQIVGQRPVEYDLDALPAYKSGSAGRWEAFDHRSERCRPISDEEAEQLPWQDSFSPAAVTRAVRAKHGDGEWDEEFDTMLPAPSDRSAGAVLG
jgi:immunity protein 26 of polymorphic toxin system